jgi:tetratricopeptide (TPR) repeat protein
MIDQSEKLLQSGIAAQNEALFDDASFHFWQSLSCLDRLPAAEPRRDQTRRLAAVFFKGGHEDLCILAAREAIWLDEALNDQKTLAGDLVFYAKVHNRLGNKEETKASLKEAIDLFLEVGEYAAASSASTNLSSLIAQSGDTKGAITLLTNSLAYLKKEPDPDKEFNTYAMMILVVDMFGGDPAVAVKSGIAISEKFSDRLTEQDRIRLGQPLQKAVEAFLAKKPQPDPDAWKKQNLPWVY